MNQFTTPGGERLIVLSEHEYEDLVDARDATIALQGMEGGRMETIPASEMDEALTTPIAYWRCRRGLTQSALAEAAGVSRAYVAQIEGGHRVGDVRLYSTLARLLGVRIEDLVRDDVAAG